MTVASGTVLVPAGEHVTAVIYLSSDGSATVTGFSNHRSILPVDRSQLVLRNTADAPPVDVYLDGTKVASGLSNDPSSPMSASILTTKGPATIAVTRVGAPLGQALVLHHVELGAGELVDMFLVGDSTHHPSTLGLIADTIPLGVGYRLYASDGGVFDYGDPAFFGSTGGLSLDAPVSGAAPTSSGGGYWLVGADGGVFSFGDAAFFGSAANVKLDKPIVGIAGDPDDAGYWLVAGDGGVLTSGSAPFYGSTAGLPVKRPIVGMAATPDGRGYWVGASDGGVFSFGDAAFYGSTGAIDLNKPVVAIIPTINSPGLLAGGLRRRRVQLRRRHLLRLDRRHPPGQTRRGGHSDAGLPRVLVGGLRRRRVQLRGCHLLRLDGRYPPEQAHCRGQLPCTRRSS